MPTKREIENFIEAISKPCPSGMFNPWSQQSAYDKNSHACLARQERFRYHLLCPNPRILLIGEAAGYQGCRFSGIPFTSERLLLEGEIPGTAILNERLSTRGRPWSEPSATIVWKTLHKLGLAKTTVLFNAVPWHPEGKKGAFSNRTPTTAEKEAGLPYLKQFISLFPNLPIAALGLTAKTALDLLNLNHTQIRHPAYGGAKKFREGLNSLVNNKRNPY
ncbi:uracil-DNA glycosylase [Nitrospira defluvii]|nr:uracil-DNA glycosylase [Nitrospira defluvii]